MRPSSWIVSGLPFLAIDMRIGGFDLLPDPLGWALILVGARDLARSATLVGIGFAAATSFTDVLLPYHWVRVDPVTGRVIDEVTAPSLGDSEMLVFDRLSGLRLALAVLAFATTALATWMLLRDLTERARGAGRTPPAQQLGLLRGLVPGLWVGPHLLAALAALLAGGSFDPVWNHNLEYVVLAGLIPVAWLGLLLVLERDRAWAVPAGSVTPPPWPGAPLGETGGQTRRKAP